MQKKRGGAFGNVASKQQIKQYGKFIVVKLQHKITKDTTPKAERTAVCNKL